NSAVPDFLNKTQTNNFQHPDNQQSSFHGKIKSANWKSAPATTTSAPHPPLPETRSLPVVARYNSRYPNTQEWFAPSPQANYPNQILPPESAGALLQDHTDILLLQQNRTRANP